MNAVRSYQLQIRTTHRKRCPYIFLNFKATLAEAHEIQKQLWIASELHSVRPRTKKRPEGYTLYLQRSTKGLQEL